MPTFEQLEHLVHCTVSAIQIHVMGHIELEGARVEQVVNMRYEEVFFLFVFDDHIDLHQILKADVYALMRNMRDN